MSSEPQDQFHEQLVIAARQNDESITQIEQQMQAAEANRSYLEHEDVVCKDEDRDKISKLEEGLRKDEKEAKSAKEKADKKKKEADLADEKVAKKKKEIQDARAREQQRSQVRRNDINTEVNRITDLEKQLAAKNERKHHMTSLLRPEALESSGSSQVALARDDHNQASAVNADQQGYFHSPGAVAGNDPRQREPPLDQQSDVQGLRSSLRRTSLGPKSSEQVIETASQNQAPSGNSAQSTTTGQTSIQGTPRNGQPHIGNAHDATPTMPSRSAATPGSSSRKRKHNSTISAAGGPAQPHSRDTPISTPGGPAQPHNQGQSNTPKRVNMNRELEKLAVLAAKTVHDWEISHGTEVDWNKLKAELGSQVLDHMSNLRTTHLPDDLGDSESKVTPRISQQSTLIETLLSDVGRMMAGRLAELRAAHPYSRLLKFTSDDDFMEVWGSIAFNLRH